QPGYLVLADTYYPGWVARVDGVEQPILRADYLFRAVAVRPGQQVVEFRYEPTSFRIGAATSGLTLLVLVALVAATLVDPARWPVRRSRPLALDPALDPAGS